MGIHSGKFYDAKKMQEYCDMMKNAASKYNDEAELTHSDYDGFHATEKFMGITADAMKTLIKSGLGNNLSVVSETHGKMKTAQEEVITMFEEMVDHSQNARIEYDTLEMINNFYKDLYYEFKDIAANVKKLVDGLNEEFGNYAYFEQPDSQSAMDAFIDFCGGEDDSAGYIKKCQNKFLAFDEAAKEYLKARDTVTRATKVDTNIINCISTLSAPIDGKSAGGKIELTSVKNAKPKGAKESDNAFITDDVVRIFKRTITFYNIKNMFSDEEIEFLKNNYPNLLLTYLMAKMHDPNKADKIMSVMQDIITMYYLIEDCNLTVEQKEYVYNLSSLVGTSSDYTEKRVGELQVTAAYLFEAGESAEFIAGVLGNIMNEGGVGNIENANYKDGCEIWYLKNIISYASGVGYNTFKKDYSGWDNFLYDNISYDEYSGFINDYIDSKPPKNVVWGCGECQWTDADRIKTLFDYYEEEDKNKDKSISYAEAIRAENRMLVYELTSPDSQFASIDDEYNENTIEPDKSKNIEIVRKGALDFREKYEISASPEIERADSAETIYRAMMRIK